jgi:hypothetical protein
MTIRQRILNISLSKFQQLDSVGHSLGSLIRPVLKEAPGGGVIAGSRLSCRVTLINDAAAVEFRDSFGGLRFFIPPAPVVRGREAMSDPFSIFNPDLIPPILNRGRMRRFSFTGPQEIKGRL